MFGTWRGTVYLLIDCRLRNSFFGLVAPCGCGGLNRKIFEGLLWGWPQLSLELHFLAVRAPQECIVCTMGELMEWLGNRWVGSPYAWRDSMVCPYSSQVRMTCTHNKTMSVPFFPLQSSWLLLPSFPKLDCQPFSPSNCNPEFECFLSADSWKIVPSSSAAILKIISSPCYANVNAFTSCLGTKCGPLIGLILASDLLLLMFKQDLHIVKTYLVGYLNS